MKKKLVASIISFTMVALSAPLCFAADGIDLSLDFCLTLFLNF